MVSCILHSEILDEAEFGDAADNFEYDENTINSALELGLMVWLSDKRNLEFILNSWYQLLTIYYK